MPRTHEERRRFQRIVMRRRVTVDCPEGKHTAELLDISLKGALITRDNTWQPQTGWQTAVTINLGDSADALLLRLLVRIAHVEAEHVGLQLLSMDLDSATALRRLVELNLADPLLLERELEQLSTSRE